MKKTLYIIFTALTISIFTHSSFADECSQSCSIKDAPAPVLQEYINSNRKIISNIANQLTANNTNNIFNQQYNKIYNSITNWNTFNSWVDFLKLELSWEVPLPIKRDIQLLKKEWQYLAKFLQNSILQNSSNTLIDNACNWVSSCQLSGTASDIIWKLIENHSNVMEFYKLSLLGKSSGFQWNFILVKPNFKSELNNYYNSYTLTDCSKCEWEFNQKIEKAIKAISVTDKNSKDWIQQWRDAWSILNGSKNWTAEYNTRERELLQKKLSKDWVTWNNGDTILKNLDKYNNNAYSNQNNPVNNSFSIFKDTVERNANAVNFASNVYKTVKQLYNKTTGYFSKNPKAVIPVSILTQTDWNITSANAIMRAVDNIYQREVPFISAQDTNSDKLQARIIQMHIDLSQAINILDKTRKFSEKVCNDQDRWNGRCKY